MKKEHRAIYLALGEVLCCFCRYATRKGDSYDGYYYYSCKHPLYGKSPRFEYMADKTNMNSAGSKDCWGFRPKVAWDVAHGMVANWRQGKDANLLPDLLLKKGGRAFS